jgi:hypothetical protein
MTLADHLRQLLARMSGRPDQPPTPSSILIAELRPGDCDGGRPRIRQANLRTPEEYEPRFRELLGMGFGWLNMNYSGTLRGQGLVLIEYPRSPAQRTGTTWVAYSGPPKLVAAAGWDALAYVVVS